MCSTGQEIAGKWRLERCLGTGAFGEVWVGRHSVTGLRKAIKLLNAGHSHNPALRERFVSEARAAAQIDSPHVIAVDDVGYDEACGRAYLVMDLVRGESLFAYMNHEPYVVDVGPSVAVLRQIAAALDAAHRVGIIHRDLKPENVCLSWRVDGSVLVKVVDFGIAKLADSVRESQPPSPHGIRRALTEGFIGTPGYAAPEQIADSRTVGPAADVFAFGVIAFELLSGCTYWQESGSLDLLLEVSNGATVPASERFPPTLTVPPTFDAWFARCCAADPGARFESAGEALLALEQALCVAEPVLPPEPRTRVSVIPEACEVRSPPAPESAPLVATVEPPTSPPSIAETLVAVSTAPDASRPSRRRAGRYAPIAAIAMTLAVAAFGATRPRVQATKSLRGLPTDSRATQWCGSACTRATVVPPAPTSPTIESMRVPMAPITPVPAASFEARRAPVIGVRPSTAVRTTSHVATRWASRPEPYEPPGL